MAAASPSERLRDITWQQYAFVAACSLLTYGVVYAASANYNAGADEDSPMFPGDGPGGSESRDER